jgi:RNA recognition motif-containing protein
MLIRVSNLDRSTSADDLWDLFAEFGDVEEVEINEAPDPGKDTFTAWIEMPYDSEAEEAISELRGERIDGKALTVRPSNQKERENPLEEATPVNDELDWDDDDI